MFRSIFCILMVFGTQSWAQARSGFFSIPTENVVCTAVALEGRLVFRIYYKDSIGRNIELDKKMPLLSLTSASSAAQQLITQCNVSSSAIMPDGSMAKFMWVDPNTLETRPATEAMVPASRCKGE